MHTNTKFSEKEYIVIQTLIITDKRHSMNVELQNEKKEMILHYVSPSNKIDISDGGYSHL